MELVLVDFNATTCTSEVLNVHGADEYSDSRAIGVYELQIICLRSNVESLEICRVFAEIVYAYYVLVFNLVDFVPYRYFSLHSRPPDDILDLTCPNL